MLVARLPRRITIPFDLLTTSTTSHVNPGLSVSLRYPNVLDLRTFHTSRCCLVEESKSTGKSIDIDTRGNIDLESILPTLSSIIQDSRPASHDSSPNHADATLNDQSKGGPQIREFPLGADDPVKKKHAAFAEIIKRYRAEVATLAATAQPDDEELQNLKSSIRVPSQYLPMRRKFSFPAFLRYLSVRYPKSKQVSDWWLIESVESWLALSSHERARWKPPSNYNAAHTSSSQSEANSSSTSNTPVEAGTDADNAGKDADKVDT